MGRQKSHCINNLALFCKVFIFMRSMRSKKNIYNRINTLTGTHRQIMRSKMRSTARRCVPKNFSLDKATTPYRIINASPVILSTGRASPRWVPYTASRNRHHVDEESRLDTLKLCKPSIPVYHADGRRVMLGIEQVRILKIAGRMARLIQRKKDGAITRGYMKAAPNEIGTRITAAPTVVKVLPTTYTHRSSLMAGL